MKTGKTTTNLLQNALAAGRAIPAFNIPYLPMMEPVVDAIKDADTVAMVAVARLEWVKFEARGIEPVYRAYERHADPDYVRIHLDHTPVIDEDGLRIDFEAEIQQALALGYQSVMIDGSRLPFEENVAATARAVAIAHAAGVPVEAELGAVMGHEANPNLSYEEILRTRAGFTNPEEAATFVQRTGCDWLSIAFGNIHGAVSEALRDQPKVAGRLDVEHLAAIWKRVNIPLVLHGGSGIPRDNVQAAVRQGIAKVNVGTDIRQVYERTLRETAGEAAAQKAVYRRTRELLADYFAIEGLRTTLVGR